MTVSWYWRYQDCLLFSFRTLVLFCGSLMKNSLFVGVHAIKSNKKKYRKEMEAFAIEYECVISVCVLRSCENRFDKCDRPVSGGKGGGFVKRIENGSIEPSLTALLIIRAFYRTPSPRRNR